MSDMALSNNAAKQANIRLDESKAKQINENTDTEIKKNEVDTEMNKGKKTAQIDANF